jgi:hypothetical protein
VSPEEFAVFLIGCFAIGWLIGAAITSLRR